MDNFNEQLIKLSFDDNKQIYIELKKLQKFPHLMNIKNELESCHDFLSTSNKTNEIILYIPSTKNSFMKALNIINGLEKDYDISYVKLLDFLGIKNVEIPTDCELNEENYMFLLIYNNEAAYKMFKYNTVNKFYTGPLDYIHIDHLLNLCNEYSVCRKYVPKWLNDLLENPKKVNDNMNGIQFFKHTTNYVDKSTLSPYINTNIIFGHNAGINYKDSRYAGSIIKSDNFNNICLNNPGKYKDQNTTRIGNTKTKKTFIHGINNPIKTFSQQVMIDQNGKLGTISDATHHKKDITDISTSLNTENIYNLTPICYKYIEDENETNQYGLDIKEVTELYPEIVNNESINYNAIIMMMLKEMQNLKMQVVELTKKIEIQNNC